MVYRLLRSIGVGVLLSFGAVALAHAQSGLYADYNGRMRLVERVLGMTPYVDDGSGKLVEAASNKYALAPVSTYAPFYVAIHDIHVNTGSVELETGNTINHEFDFRAEFESRFVLDDVFLVLDLMTTAGERVLFVHEIGHLEPHKPQQIHGAIALAHPIGEGHYQTHVFVGGAEVFHTNMSVDAIESKLDEMVRKQIQGVTDAMPKPFFGPPAEYPPELEQQGVKGRAVVHFAISPTGRIVDPKVVSATQPAFGESALETIRLWRFLPRVKDGIPRQIAVDLPFDFSPPVKK